MTSISKIKNTFPHCSPCCPAKVRTSTVDGESWAFAHRAPVPDFCCAAVSYKGNIAILQRCRWSPSERYTLFFLFDALPEQGMLPQTNPKHPFSQGHAELALPFSAQSWDCVLCRVQGLLVLIAETHLTLQQNHLLERNTVSQGSKQIHKTLFLTLKCGKQILPLHAGKNFPKNVFWSTSCEASLGIKGPDTE